ncbi:transposase [Bradyrhizobium elkanii]|nr:transposase [Bradyrhizobium elkanii]MCS3558509.1 transposase [Bradyrhizobium elkanii]MCW2151644.1 transposase [Bradyrhizobium elkanii]MCW2358483.1 transposase [Bradyrhizobium elkanii]MCW2375375.1 transposase [Bradyrhizobium elkanii]
MPKFSNDRCGSNAPLGRLKRPKLRLKRSEKPPRSNRNDAICFSPYLYRARNQVERFFNRIKQCRQVATRYDRLAANYLAFVQLASIRRWLRLYESAS